MPLHCARQVTNSSSNLGTPPRSSYQMVEALTDIEAARRYDLETKLRRSAMVLA
jgi:hypothetical protein